MRASRHPRLARTRRSVACACALASALVLAVKGDPALAAASGLPAYAGPKELPSATIAVDARTALRDNEPFWAAIVFHPTEYLSTDWGRNYLRTLHQTGACHTYVRLYNQPEDAAQLNADGTVSWNWAHFDERADYVLQQGLKPLVAFAFMPTQIAADPKAGRHRPFLDGKWICYSPPKDYALWRAMCEDFTRHVIERYGEDEIAQWYFTCWNEPDLASFWHEGDTAEYLKLYDHFAAGVKGVSQRVRIGGPAYSGGRTYRDPSSWRGFLQHVISGANFATGQTGTPLDYIDIHSYGGGGAAGAPGSPFPSVDYIMAQQLKMAGIRDEFPQLREVPIFVVEWGLSSSGSRGMDEQPMAEVRNSQYAAAFLTTMVARHARLRLTDDPRVTNFMICLSGHEVTEKRDFEGRRVLVTVNGVHTPMLNGYQLLAKVGADLVACTLDVEHPSVAAIATRDGEERVTVLVTHFLNNAPANDGPAAPVHLRIESPWPDGTAVELKHWRVDETHSNAYTVYRQLGRPEKPTPEQMQQLKSRMDLELLEAPRTLRTNGRIELAFDLPCNGASLLELRRR